MTKEDFIASMKYLTACAGAKARSTTSITLVRAACAPWASCSQQCRVGLARTERLVKEA